MEVLNIQGDSVELLLSKNEVKAEVRDLLFVALTDTHLDTIVDSIYPDVENLLTEDMHSTNDVRNALGETLVKRLIG